MKISNILIGSILCLQSEFALAGKLALPKALSEAWGHGRVDRA